MVVTVAQQCQYTSCHWTIHLKIVQIVNFCYAYFTIIEEERMKGASSNSTSDFQPQGSGYRRKTALHVYRWLKVCAVSFRTVSQTCRHYLTGGTQIKSSIGHAHILKAPQLSKDAKDPAPMFPRDILCTLSGFREFGRVAWEKFPPPCLAHSGGILSFISVILQAQAQTVERLGRNGNCWLLPQTYCVRIFRSEDHQLVS